MFLRGFTAVCIAISIPLALAGGYALAEGVNQSFSSDTIIAKMEKIYHIKF